MRSGTRQGASFKGHEGSSFLQGPSSIILPAPGQGAIALMCRKDDSEIIRVCKKIGIKGIVLKSKENIILDKNSCINFANKNKMFISVK